MKEPIILAIDTSCDETSAAVTCGRRILSNIISSQTDLHKKYGGVYPALAKRAHEERIDFVIKEALKQACKTLRCKWKEGSSLIQAIAVTQGPGLAIALEVGIRKAKELATGCGWEMKNRLGSKSEKRVKPKINSSPIPTPNSQSSLHSHLPLIAINHLEGHIYSCFAQNSQGNPQREITFPSLCLIVSGGHTLLALMTDHGQYQTLGSTLDDACGEALDKGARILQLGYPGGPIIERLAEEYFFSHPRFSPNEIPFKLPLLPKNNLNFSYSGLKTQLLYLVQKTPPQKLGENLHFFAAAFQEACFEQLARKTSLAIDLYQPKNLICGGGVTANSRLRQLLRQLGRKKQIPVFFPPFKKLATDNAAMIGLTAHDKFLRGEFVENINELDRLPRLSL